MSGGGKGGSQTQTSKVEIPKWLERPAKDNIARANEIARLGYVPYYGPDVAAFTPMQEAAFANTGAAANAFGMQGGMGGMPEAQTFANGVRGYSSAPLFEESLSALQQNRPGQYNAINNMFIDPVTGGMGGASSGQGAQPQYDAQMQSFMTALQAGANPMTAWTQAWEPVGNSIPGSGQFQDGLLMGSATPRNGGGSIGSGK